MVAEGAFGNLNRRGSTVSPTEDADGQGTATATAALWSSRQHAQQQPGIHPDLSEFSFFPLAHRRTL